MGRGGEGGKEGGGGGGGEEEVNTHCCVGILSVSVPLFCIHSLW